MLRFPSQFVSTMLSEQADHRKAYKLGCVQIRLAGIPEHLTPVFIKDHDFSGLSVPSCTPPSREAESRNLEYTTGRCPSPQTSVLRVQPLKEHLKDGSIAGVMLMVYQLST